MNNFEFDSQHHLVMLQYAELTLKFMILNMGKTL